MLFNILISRNYNIHICCQQFIYGLILCNFDRKMFRTIYYIFRTSRSMSASAAFSYGAEERFVISNIGKCRKLSTAEAFRRSTHCPPIHSPPACINTLTSTLSLCLIFFCFSSSWWTSILSQQKRLIQVIHFI